MISSELSNFRWHWLLLIVSYFYDSASTCDWFKIFTPKCLYFRDRFLARAILRTICSKMQLISKWRYSQEGCLEQINFKFYLHVFTGCYKHFFSSCIHICIQVVLPFVFKLYWQDSHLFSSCITICFQVVLPFVFKLYYHLFSSCIGKVAICFQVVIYKLLLVSTSCYNVLQVHVST